MFKTPTMTPQSGPVAKCIEACKATTQEVNKKQVDALKLVFIKYYQDLDKLGAKNVIIAVARKDMLGAIKTANDMLEKPALKEIIFKMLKDVAQIYTENASAVDKIIMCYLQNCDAEALDFMKESIRMVINLVTLGMDAKIQQQMRVIQSTFLKNFSRAAKILGQPVPAPAPKEKRTIKKATK